MPGSPTVDVVLPVRDEAAVLEASVRKVHAHLSDGFPLPWSITIAENGSTDGTADLAAGLAAELTSVRVRTGADPGRGGALRDAWTASDADLLVYMDIDLSTRLEALYPLVAPLVSGHSDLAVGTRLAPTSRVARGARREAISRAYNRLLRFVVHAGFTDAQCGFKAIRSDVARQLLPLVEDDQWFFDAELLILAEHLGYRIFEVPVDWVDDADSRVEIRGDSGEALRGVVRMVRRLATESFEPAPGRPARPGPPLATQLVRFGSIGLVSTVVFAALFAVLRDPLGAVAADVVALAVCALLNTSANRRLTFELRGRAGWALHQAAAALVLVLPLALNLAMLAVVESAGLDSLGWQLAALTLANAVATVIRFVLLRSWVFRPVRAVRR